MNGPTLLAAFLKDKRLSQAGFATAHGFSPPLVSMWLNALRVPGLENAMALEEATGGKVPAKSWHRTTPRRSPSHPRRMKRSAA